MTTRKGEFNGRPTLSLLRTPDDEYPFTFGIGKARLIVENYPAIAKFVKENPPTDSAKPKRGRT